MTELEKKIIELESSQTVENEVIDDWENIVSGV